MPPATRWFSEGPRDAKIVIVGEAPGGQEVQAGRPFIGGSGQLLDRLLSEVGISRRECFVTNVCHVQPPNNDWVWFTRKANQEHLIRGMLKLRADLEEIKPNLVLALGSQPLQVLTGAKSITKWRGSILPSKLVPGLKVLGTFHPAAILRTYDYGAVARFDLAKAARECSSPHIVYPRRRIILPDGVWVRDGVGVTEWSWESEAWDLPEVVRRLEQSGRYSVDIECYETSPGKWELACVGFCSDPSWAVSIPADTPQNLAWIKRLVENDCQKIYQNGAFDTSVLMDLGYEPKNFWWDTMWAHHVLYAECAGGSDEVSNMTKTKRQAAISKGLAFLTSINTNEPFYKDDGKLWKASGDVRIFRRYNALDCCTTLESQQVQENDLRDFGVLDQFHQRMELTGPLIEATRTGIRVDLARRKQLLDDVTKKEGMFQALLDAAAGHPVNVSSNPQVTKLLYDELKLPVKQKKIKGRLTGSRSGDAATLDDLAAKYPGVPALRAILHVREQRVLRERYLDTPIGQDGRIRCSFDATGTRSYRLASRASLDGTGTNLQNQPVFVRECYVADPGYALISSDYSQAEAVVVAYEAEDENLQAIFADPTRDLHRETAAAALSIDLAAVGDAERYIGKRGGHATNYGMMPPKLVEIVESDYESTGIRITLREAERVIANIHAARPNLKNVYWRDVQRDLRDSRTLTNAFGYKRTFFGRFDDNLVRDGYSWKPQSTVGILGCMAWIAVAKAIRPLGGVVLLNVHDSLVVQCPVDVVDKVAALMVEAMTIPITIKGKTFTLRIDTDVGYNWGKRKEKKDGTVVNPNGLRSLEKFLAHPEYVDAP